MTEKATMSDEEAKEFREIAKQIGYTFWKHSFSISNPSATVEDRALAWDSARETQVKATKRALQELHKAGLIVTKT